MKNLFALKIFLLILLSVCPASNALEITDFPEWINELRLNASKTFHAEVELSNINIADRLAEGAYFVFSLKGEGRLDQVPDPFHTMHKMFSSTGWGYIPRYQADGHGSSSFAYEKGNNLCNIYVTIDSSCDDEETDHVPSRFWFDIYCREQSKTTTSASRFHLFDAF